MISINRKPLPEELRRSLARISAEIAGHLARGENLPARLSESYRRDDLKRHLLEETHGKCAYCEANFSATYPGDIEHIKPKSKHKHLLVDYDNLTVACFSCNNAKGSYDGDLVHPFGKEPYPHDPHEEIHFVGSTIELAFCKPLGELTVENLKLLRPELNIARYKVFHQLAMCITRWKTAAEKYKQDPSPRNKHDADAALLAIWQFAEPEASFSSMCRHGISLLGVPARPTD